MSLQHEPTMLAFFHYHHWANQTLMGICLNVSDTLMAASIPGAYGSIYATFTHVLKAEISFLQRIHGSYPHPDFTWDEHPSLSRMMAYETVLHDALVDTLRHIPATQDVHEAGDGWSFDYDARLIFMSVVYHGIAHRTDITTTLNNNGVTLPELDIWGYQSAYPEQFHARTNTTGQ